VTSRAQKRLQDARVGSEQVSQRAFVHLLMRNDQMYPWELQLSCIRRLERLEQ